MLPLLAVEREQAEYDVNAVASMTPLSHNSESHTRLKSTKAACPSQEGQAVIVSTV